MWKSLSIFNQEIWTICCLYLDLETIHELGQGFNRISFPPLNVMMLLCKLSMRLQRCIKWTENPLPNFQTVCNFQKCLDARKEIFSLISCLEQELENRKCCAFFVGQPDWINQMEFMPEDLNLSYLEKLQCVVSDFKTVFHTLEEEREKMKKKALFFLWAARIYNYFGNGE